MQCIQSVINMYILLKVKKKRSILYFTRDEDEFRKWKSFTWTSLCLGTLFSFPNQLKIFLNPQKFGRRRARPREDPRTRAEERDLIQATIPVNMHIQFWFDSKNLVS